MQGPGQYVPWRTGLRGPSPVHLPSAQALQPPVIAGGGDRAPVARCQSSGHSAACPAPHRQRMGPQSPQTNLWLAGPCPSENGRGIVAWPPQHARGPQQHAGRPRHLPRRRRAARLTFGRCRPPLWQLRTGGRATTWPRPATPLGEAAAAACCSDGARPGVLLPPCMAAGRAGAGCGQLARGGDPAGVAGGLLPPSFPPAPRLAATPPPAPPHSSPTITVQAGGSASGRGDAAAPQGPPGVAKQPGTITGRRLRTDSPKSADGGGEGHPVKRQASMGDQGPEGAGCPGRPRCPWGAGPYSHTPACAPARR